jgi:predicted PurR-regulated permease PerM
MHDRKLSRYFFVAVLLGTAVVFFRMVQVFFLPVVLAAVFATLFYEPPAARTQPVPRVEG